MSVYTLPYRSDNSGFVVGSYGESFSVVSMFIVVYRYVTNHTESDNRYVE